MNKKQEQIILAQSTKEVHALKQLSLSTYSSVTKNNSAPIQIIEILC